MSRSDEQWTGRGLNRWSLPDSESPPVSISFPGSARCNLSAACAARWDARRRAISYSPDVHFPGPAKGAESMEQHTPGEGTRAVDKTAPDGLGTWSDRDIIAEFSHQDSLLQAYRQQFLVAETFTAAVAAATVFSNPIMALALTFLGIVILVGWILVTRSRARVLYYWYGKLRH